MVNLANVQPNVNLSHLISHLFTNHVHAFPHASVANGQICGSHIPKSLF